MLRSFSKKLIEFYSFRLPYHKGKWRVVEVLLRACRVDALDCGKTFTVERGGVRWKLENTCSVQRRLLYHGAFDIYDLHELLRRLGDGAMFFDVGSYFGYYSMLVASRAHADVCAFEAVSANYALLEKNKKLNSFERLRTFHVAVSDEAGEVSFETPPAGNRGTGRIATGDAASVEKVKAITLDQFAAGQGIKRLDAMKIDVEGAEIKVLRGARATIEKFKPTMVIELNPPCLRRFGASERELLDAITGLGYDIFRATSSGLVKFKGLAPGEDYANIFCVTKTA